MKIFLNKFSKNITKKSILVIGNFDGVHLGHESLFLRAKKIAKKNKTKFGALTFNPNPKGFFSKDKKINIISFSDKIKILNNLNLDYLIVLKFNNKFRSISAEDFINKILIDKINPSLTIVGKEFRFGKNRIGNTNLLKEKLNVLSPPHIKFSKKKISSSEVRKLISKGQVHAIKKHLGRNWFISGKIINGREVGRKIGFRTANIDLGNYLEPKKGVYAVHFFIKNKKYKGVANFGDAPTFKRNKAILEVHLFQSIKNIYNKEVKVEFVKYIREEKKFKNTSLLIKQINKDVKEVKKILSNAR
jgi:riboflavin kinase/FMN adenylyltransferase